MSEQRVGTGAAGRFLRIAIQALALGALGCAAVPEPAADSGPLDVDMVELEQAFWACDYVATTSGVQATPVAACRYVTEELKVRKFGGSFGQMLEWWRANKPAAHRRIARLVEQ
jgi:hypothetical protein